MSKQVIGMRRSLGPYEVFTIPSGSNCTEVIDLGASSYGGFILPDTFDAVTITFAPQENADDDLSSYVLTRYDGTTYDYVANANGAYAFPGALFGHLYARIKLSGNAAADRDILVHRGN